MTEAFDLFYRASWALGVDEDDAPELTIILDPSLTDEQIDLSVKFLNDHFKDNDITVYAQKSDNETFASQQLQIRSYDKPQDITKLQGLLPVSLVIDPNYRPKRYIYLTQYFLSSASKDDRRRYQVAIGVRGTHARMEINEGVMIAAVETLNSRYAKKGVNARASYSVCPPPRSENEPAFMLSLTARDHKTFMRAGGVPESLVLEVRIEPN